MARPPSVRRVNPPRFVAPLAALALTFAAAACSDDESVFNAEVGECIESVSQLSGEISELPETDCSEPHEAEVFFLFQHEGDDDEFPGNEAVAGEAQEACEGDAFEDYTGTSYDESAIGVAPITPTEQSWGDGDRESICVAFVPGEEVTSSFEGNGEDFPLGAGGSTPPAGGSGGAVEAGEPTEPPSLDDPDLAALAQSCFDGDGRACDDLFFQTDVGSEEETYGATCGGRFEEPPPGGCLVNIEG